MYVKLEKKDYKKIAEMIHLERQKSGSFCYSDLYINVDYKLSIEGYNEHDTNAWITTDVSAEVKLSFDDADVVIDYDKNELENVVEEYIKD